MQLPPTAGYLSCAPTSQKALPRLCLSSVQIDCEWIHAKLSHHTSTPRGAPYHTPGCSASVGEWLCPEWAFLSVFASFCFPQRPSSCAWRRINARILRAWMMENTQPFIFVECYLQRSIGLKHSFDLTLIFAQIFKIWTLRWWFQGWMHLKVRPHQGCRSESKECSHKGRTVVSGSQIHSPQYGRGRTWNIQLGVIIYTTKRLIQIVLWLAFFKILDRLAWSVLWRKLNSDKALDKSSMEWEWLHNNIHKL